MTIEYTPEQLALQPQLLQANINPESFLATDYLNHFNEIVMLLEMVPDMPELFEDVADWQPKTYNQHFMDSGFQAKELAIKAYNIAPAPIIANFEKICAELDKLVSGTINGLQAVNVVERGLSEQAQALIRNRVASIQEMLMQMNKVIHGNIDAPVAQVEEVVFIFNLEYRLPLYQEGYHMDCQQSLNAHIA